MRQGVLIGLIAVVCWTLAVGTPVAGDVTVMAQGGGKGPHLKAPAPVPQTGQTICYDASGQIIDCTDTGQDGELQKGVPWPDPRFTDNGAGTVTDNLTGLVWLKDANCILTTYPEFDTDNLAGDGGVTWQHALDFVAGINNGSYPKCGAGYTDWRLPNVRELHSLLDYGRYYPAFPEIHPFPGVVLGRYWSSTTYASSTLNAWVVNFTWGPVTPEDQSRDFYVWCVRGGK